MTEKVLRFGPDGNLLGILTEPTTLAPQAPAVLFLNAGVLHRAGPFNWYVTLARRLAGLGILSLRFDLSGVGDSVLRPDDRSEVERALDDIRTAADVLALRKGVSRFVLLGLCSGAMFAHHAAGRDPRVVGAVFLDGFGYRTPGYWLRYYGPRLRSPASWLGLGRRLLGRIIPGLKARRDPQAPQFEDYFVDFPPRPQVRAELQTLLQRGVRLLFLYTGGLADQYFNHLGQFREMYGDLDSKPGQLQVEYDDRADHLYTDLERREAMFTCIEGWLQPWLR